MLESPFPFVAGCPDFLLELPIPALGLDTAALGMNVPGPFEVSEVRASTSSSIIIRTASLYRKDEVDRSSFPASLNN